MRPSLVSAITASLTGGRGGQEIPQDHREIPQDHREIPPPMTTPQWITDRLPTKEDADRSDDVRIPRTLGSRVDRDDDWRWQHYSLVVPGQPWWSPNAAEPAPSPERRIVQVAGTGSDVVALCNDGTSWRRAGNGNWHQLPPIPHTSQ